MVDKKLSEFSQITPAEIAKLICLYLDQNNAIKNGVVDFAALDALLAHKAGDETFTGNKTFSGDTVFSGNATFNQTVNANISGSSGSCTGNSATATKATQDGSGNNIANTYATKTELDTELSGKVDLNLNNMNPSQTAKETITGWGMPSSSYVNVSTPAVNVEGSYTAPANGYMVGSFNVQSVKNYYLLNSSAGFLGTCAYAANAGTYRQRLFCPIAKGQTAVFKIEAGSYEYLRFYYAEGEL